MAETLWGDCKKQSPSEMAKVFRRPADMSFNNGDWQPLKANGENR
jgi:hypothetical protein